jgi:hypothetical protein
MKAENEDQIEDETLPMAEAIAQHHTEEEIIEMLTRAKILLYDDAVDFNLAHEHYLILLTALFHRRGM